MYGVRLQRVWLKNGLRRYNGFLREESIFKNQIRCHGGGGHSHSHARDAMENQTVEAKRITWIGIGVNGVMGTGKLAAGVMFNSAAYVFFNFKHSLKSSHKLDIHQMHKYSSSLSLVRHLLLHILTLKLLLTIT